MAEYNKHNPFYKQGGFWKWASITLAVLFLVGSIFNLTPAGRQSAEQQSIEDTVRKAALQEKERGHIVYAAELDRMEGSHIEAIELLYAQTVEESLGVIQSIEDTVRKAALQEKERGHIVYAAELDQPVSSRIQAIEVLYAQTVEESLGVIQAIEPVDDYEAVHVIVAEEFELSPSLVKKEFYEMFGQRLEKITREMLYDGHDGGTFRNVQFLNPEGEQLAKTGVFQGKWRVK